MRTGGSSLGLSNGSLQLNFIDKSRGNRYGPNGTMLYLSSPIILIVIIIIIIIIIMMIIIIITNRLNAMPSIRHIGDTEHVS